MKPRDREVVCHASAWDVNAVDDLRLKLCIEINAENFSTIHHELGHSFYQRAYDRQPPCFEKAPMTGFTKRSETQSRYRSHLSTW